MPSPDSAGALSGQWRVAIIGAGMGGSHAAAALREEADRSGVAVEIDVYERKQRAGGRAFAERVLGSTSELELGASMMIRQNRYMLQAAQAANLPVRFQDDASLGAPRMAIWDGRVMRFVEGNWRLATMLRLVFRYGPLPMYRLLSAASNFIAKFDLFYSLQERGETFDTAEEMWGAVGMLDEAASGGAEALNSALGSGSVRLVDELVGGLMRNNYNMLPAEATALTCFTSVAPLAAGGSAAAWSVPGGNHRIALSLLDRAGANLRFRTLVDCISRNERGQLEVHSIEAPVGGGPRGDWGVSAERSPTSVAAYDAVIIATPVSFTGGRTMQLSVEADGGVSPEGLEHQLVHVTFAAGHLSEEHFGTSAAELASIRDIFVPASTTTSYNSIGRAGERPDGTPIYKFFSTRELDAQELAPLFALGAPEIAQYQWRAYPRRSGPLPRISLGPGLIFASGAEYGTSAMEVMAVAGRNAALLAAKHLGIRGLASASSAPAKRSRL